MKTRLGWTLAALLLAAPVHAAVDVYGRINLSLERRSGPSGQQVVLADNASRFGLVEAETIAPALTAGVQFEKSFDASQGSANASGFDRQAELYLAVPGAKLSIGRFGSTAYLGIADAVSMHNHDTGISGDALFAHVEPAGRKLGGTWNQGAWTVQLVTWMPDALAGGTRGAGVLLTCDVPGLSLAASLGGQGERAQRSVRALWTAAQVDLGGYVQRDRNVYGHGERTVVRASIAWRIEHAELHLNVGTAGAYSGQAPGEGGARQATIAYNYRLSRRTKLYGLVSRVDARGTLYGNWLATAVGIRHNF